MNGLLENQESMFVQNAIVPIGIVREKKCSTCGIIKTIDNFHVGGKTYKDGFRGQCKKCRCDYTNKYQKANLDQVKKAKLLWSRANRTTLNIKGKEYYHLNIEKERSRNRLYQAKHKKEKSLSTHNRRIVNLDRERERCRKWAMDHPGRVSDRAKRRRARKINTTVESFTSVEIYERDQWVCQLCHRKVSKKLKFPNPLSPSLDHIVPLSRNGTHKRSNVQLAHLICNQQASAGGIKQLRLI